MVEEAELTAWLIEAALRYVGKPLTITSLQSQPVRDRIRERARQVCDDHGVQIEHVNKSHIRKEELVARVLAQRGDAPGLVHVISAMESCPSYKPQIDERNVRHCAIRKPIRFHRHLRRRQRLRV